MVDLKHLDLYGPDYIEREVSTHDLTYLCSSRPPTIPAGRPDANPVADSSASGAHRARQRSLSSLRQDEVA
jgi:hypothetical protein